MYVYINHKICSDCIQSLTKKQIKRAFFIEQSFNKPFDNFDDNIESTLGFNLHKITDNYHLPICFSIIIFQGRFSHHSTTLYVHNFQKSWKNISRYKFTNKLQKGIEISWKTFNLELNLKQGHLHMSKNDPLIKRPLLTAKKKPTSDGKFYQKTRQNIDVNKIESVQKSFLPY